MKVCSIDGCDQPVFGRGWCNRHYGRWRRHGDPQILLREPIDPHATEFACRRCGETKPLAQFFRDSSRPNGRHAYCKACAARESKERWAKVGPMRNALRAAQTYGLSLETYLTMRERPCEICGVLKEKMCIDHDHTTGEVRGTLCDLCNRAIGMLGDLPERLRNAAAYLEDHADTSLS